MQGYDEVFVRKSVRDLKDSNPNISLKSSQHEGAKLRGTIL